MRRSGFVIASLVILVICVVFADRADMAQAPPASPGGMFLYIQGIDGSCVKAGYEKWIELKSFNYTIDAGSQQAGARLQVDPRLSGLRLVKNVDKASPVLNSYACQGRVIREAKVLIVGSDGTTVQYKMTYILKNVLITSIAVSAWEGGAAESVSLSCEGVTWEFAPEGSKADPVRATWTMTVR